jgi:integrase/recombinase XerD
MKSSEYLAQFELVIRCKYSSQATVSNYLSAVASFFRFAAGKRGMEPVELLKNYLVWGLKNKAAKTINLHRAAVVSFFRLVKNIDIDTVSVPRRKEPKKLPKTVPQQSIAEAIRRTLNIKHRLELSLFYGCGVRLSEMAGLQRRQIRDRENLLWLQDTKGEKERIIPIPESLRTMLYEYVQDMEPDALVFGGVCRRTFEKVVAQAFARIGVHAAPHMLRHSFATDQIISGQSPFAVAAWLGHSSIKTTQIYIHLSQQRLSQSTDLLRVNENYTKQAGV